MFWLLVVGASYYLVVLCNSESRVLVRNVIRYKLWLIYLIKGQRVVLIAPTHPTTTQTNKVLSICRNYVLENNIGFLIFAKNF